MLYQVLIGHNFYHLKYDFDLLTYEKVLKLKLFGKNSNQYLKDTIGDYLIVAKKNISLNYDDTSPIFKASHAGLTKDELDIPLIVIDCNKNYQFLLVVFDVS